VPTAEITVSQSMVKSLPMTQTGARRPLESGSPNSMRGRDKTRDPAVVPDDLDRRAEHLELHALLARVVHFLPARGHLVLGPAVDEKDLLGTQSYRGARRIHGDVPASDDRHLPPAPHGRVGLGELVGAHEVHAGEETRWPSTRR